MDIVEFVVGGVKKEVFGDFKVQVLEMSFSAKQIKYSLVD